MTLARAAVFAGVPQQIELQTFPIPMPRGSEVVVRVLGCSICGSDLHSYDGRRAVPVPTILGHEIVGEIVAMGDGTPDRDLAGHPMRIGDRVTWAIVAHCGHCFFCERGLPQKCQRAVKYGHERLHAGRELLGGLAEYCLLVAGTAIVRLPDDLPLAAACPASCATATVTAALDAMVGAIGDLRHQTIGVIGVGLLGLTACAMVRSRGAKAVVAVDVDAARRERALAFGATVTVAPPELEAAVASCTDGLGLDAAIELSGVPSAFEIALPRVRIGGAFILVGSVFPSAPVPIALEQLVRRNLTLRGIHNYAPQHILSAVQFLADHHRQFPFAELVAEWYPLSEVATAFRSAANPQNVRVGISNDVAAKSIPGAVETASRAWCDTRRNHVDPK